MIERLELHLGFWNARLVWEDAALEAMSAGVDGYSGERCSVLVIWSVLTFCCWSAETPLRESRPLFRAVSQVRKVHDAFAAASEFLLLLSESKPDHPPGSEAFLVGDVIAQGRQTTAMAELAALSAVA